MNLHPIFVHFPIALLSLYVVAELVPFKIIKNQPYWFYFKALILILGVAAAFVTFGTGDGAEHAVLSGQDGLRHLVEDPRQVIQIHEAWASITLIIFSALAGGYFFAWLNILNFSRFMTGNLLQSLWKIAMLYERIVIESKLVYVLALAGLVAITVTAALGGAIVYGPTVDPFVSFIYKLLVQ